jgi:tetratricopeptide (TPR) repeat protein
MLIAGPFSQRRPGRLSPFASIGVVVLGALCLVVWFMLPLKQAPAQPGAPVSQATKQPMAGFLSPGAIRSRLTLHQVATKGAEPKLVVELSRPEGPRTFAEIANTDQGIIARELVRQALLIAARDELRLATRDEVLGEPLTAGRPSRPVEIGSVWRTDGPSKVVIRRGNPQSPEVILEHIAGPVPNEVGILAMIAPIAETLSRTEFPKALKALGASGNPNQIVNDTVLPAKVEERLAGLSFVDHFAAIRDLHKAIRESGESPARLGALARGYAQLGVLSEFHWNPAHKVFKARAMLYAQRLVARDPGSAQALQNRALVRALVGLPQEALDDLAEAAKRVDAKKNAKPPSWVPLIEAYSKNDLARLKVEDGPDVKLAALLRLLAVEYPAQTTQSLKMAREVVELVPECFRAHDAMCRASGVSNLHIATTYGPQVFVQLLPSRLKAIEGLPVKVPDQLDASAGEVGLIKSLRKAGDTLADRGEPSWGALAHLIRETRFVQVLRRLQFLRQMLCVPAEDYWNEIEPLVTGHPYKPFLEIFGRPFRDVKPSFIEFANRIDLTSLEATESALISSVGQYQKTREQHDLGFALGHGDAIVRDLAASTLVPEVPYKVLQARVMLAVAPDSPYAMSVLIDHDWDAVKDKVPAWEKIAGDSSTFLSALGRRYSTLKRYADAEKILRRSIAQSADRSAFEQLATNAKAQGDMKGWRTALEDYLAHGEDRGLDHAGVQVEIANYLIGQKRFAEAKEYADPAAESWACWAMECASRCHEGLQEWQEAELWVQRQAERYPDSSWPNWYLFCKRTGKGNLKEAKAWTESYLAANETRPDLANPQMAAYFDWLSGSPKKALDRLTRFLETYPESTFVLDMFLISDQLGEKDRRDAYLEQLCTKLKDKAPKSSIIGQMMREELADPADHPLDLAAVDRVLESIPQDKRGNTQFMVGRYLLNRGKRELAVKYLKPCAESPTTFVWLKAIAAESLKAK